MQLALDLRKLYESNYLQWLEETIECLKSRQLDAVDYDNLIEELEALVNREKRRVESLLEQIVRHLLLYQYWTVEREHNARHWRAEIVSFRNQLNKKLTSNLRNYLAQNLAEIYSDALDYVTEKTNLKTFPDTCPYSLEQLLDKNWLP